jgi:hypothetical protein
VSIPSYPRSRCSGHCILWLCWLMIHLVPIAMQPNHYFPTVHLQRHLRRNHRGLPELPHLQ